MDRQLPPVTAAGFMVTLTVGTWIARRRTNELAPVERGVEFAMCEGDKIRVLGTFSDRKPHGWRPQGDHLQSGSVCRSGCHPRLGAESPSSSGDPEAQMDSHSGDETLSRKRHV